MKRLTLLFALLLAASLAVAQDPAELEVDHNVKSAFVTPHTAWAEPYVLGKTRVLFFCRGHGCDPREAIELQQRFDIDLQMVFWGRIVDTTNEGWHGDENGIRRMARLLTQKWDTYVFMDISPEKMPVEQQYPLIKALTEGAGLVLLGSDDKRVLKDKNKLGELRAFLSDVAGAEAFTIKQGRGVRLPKRPAIEYRPGWEVAYDEWAMRLGKAVLWAASKEPKVNLKLSMPATVVDRLQASENPLKVAVEADKIGAGLTLAITLRRDDGWSKEFIPGPDIKLPAVRAGNYYWDVIARDKKNVLAFGSLPFTIISNRKVEALALDPSWAEIGDKIAGMATLAGQAAATERLVISLLDRRDREIARQIVPADAPEQAFSFEVQPWYPMLLEVRATIVDGAQEVASAWQFARVVKRNRGQFNFLMWDTPAGNLAPWAEASLANTGVSLHLRGSTPQPYIAAHDIAWVPYTTRILNTRNAEGITQPACWWDEPMIQAEVDKIVQSYVPSRQHGVFVYSLGDEGDVRGSCLSQYCLEAYRRYLKDEYQGIAALNASWGMTYASFDDVQLGKPDDNDEMEALRVGNFPRWYDRQAFQSYSFCKLCERFNKGFRTIDPDSKCGFEGAGTFRAADDLDGFVRYNTFWSPYPGTADEVVRSIAPRDFPRSNWMGYTKDADTLLEKYWRMVTRGCDSVWWWRWDAINRFHGWLSPNLDPYPAVQEIIKDTQIARDGLGDLLLNSEMQTDSIGILYSQPSAYAAKVQAGPTFGSYESNHSAFHSALRDLGYNFLYFTDRQMRLGEVDLSKFKVIILPMTQAMTAQEAELFRQYVSKGGVLIADVRPAIYDGHVKPLAAGQLDDVFGVKRAGFEEAVITDGRFTLGPSENPLKVLDLPKIRVDAGIKPDGGNVTATAGQAPIMIINEVGTGYAILLNFAFATYPSLSAEGTPEFAAEQLRNYLMQLGKVTPALQIHDAKDQRLRNVEIERWMNGPVQIVSVLRHAGQSEQAMLTLPQPMYAYDLKNRKDLGKQQWITLTITPYRAQFFALSPQPLKPVQLKAAPTMAPGGLQRVAITSTMPAGRQAVKVQVKLPDGSLADWIDPVVVADKKGATVDVPIALNDPKGAWTISATDLYTGKTTSTQFKVGD